MIAEKPSWIRHEGMQIFSIDVQPGGLRLATGGGDHKACVCVSSYFGFVVSNFLFFFCDALENSLMGIAEISSIMSIFVVLGVLMTILFSG